ncbi:hypothetical protein L0F63_006720 [Massospora cicadina]|nr:hypothetical protein L0F63_006720 [Massospora cicadina]
MVNLKLVSLKAELQLKLTTRRNPPQAETLSQNWVEALPLELLVKILRALPFSSLLGLTRACRRWRAALIQIPDLWADVVLDFTSASPNLARGSGRRQPTEFVLHSLLIRANTRLRTITLAHCPKLDWKWFVVLHHFPRPLLTRIHINNSDVSVPFLKPALRALGAQLTHLTLASCKLTEDAVALILPACPALVSLDISGMGVPSEELFLDSRGRLRRAYPSLQWLGLAETALGERFIENLGSVFPNLTGINLNKVGTFKVPMLSKLCECLPKLVDLSLQRMSYIFAYRTELILHFQLMGETYSALTHLNLSHNHFINDQALLCLSRCVASLKLLDISYTFVGGAGLALINHSPSLETLNLGSCSQMDDSAIAALTLTPCVQNCHLRALDLSGLKLEQTALSLVTRTFAPFITHLNLSSSSASYFCFQAWVAEPPQRLESLRLANCPMISTDFAAKLRSTLPWAKVYHTIPS